MMKWEVVEYGQVINILETARTATYSEVYDSAQQLHSHQSIDVRPIDTPLFFNSPAEYKSWVGIEGASQYFDRFRIFVQGQNSSCLPGCYYPVYITATRNNTVRISVSDGDDWYMDKEDIPTFRIEEELCILKDIAPFKLLELKEFGYVTG